MPKKTDQRGQIPRMRDLTIAEQDELIARWRLRKDLRTTYREVISAMLLWVIDKTNIEEFAASGHAAHFLSNPNEDLFVRMVANGYTPAEIEAALKQDETPMNWMTSDELASVAERIYLMIDFFKTHKPGSFEQAVGMYEAIGAIVRKRFIQKFGYPPEQSPIPCVRITGEEREKKKLKPTEHQPSMFSEGGDKNQ